MRAIAFLSSLPTITQAISQGEGEMTPILEAEVKHCATVIVAAFLNPRK